MKTYFSTQIYQSEIAFDLSDLQTEILQIQKLDKVGKDWSKNNYKKGYTSYSSMDQLHQLSSTFGNLQKKIDHHVARYLKDLDATSTLKNLKMTNCWVNIMPKGTQHSAHLHPHSVISGSFYVHVSPDSSAIKFEDPRLSQLMNAPMVKQAARSFNKRFVSLQPKAGDVILFESWLKHEVPTNESSEPRVSISFNYGWK